ncbi:hypothetical protein BD413DRAFT_499868 [Trametes elegans]|nr:hypothetical protein BD413DRAFT_499868 [Trametes elegans]
MRLWRFLEPVVVFSAYVALAHTCADRWCGSTATAYNSMSHPCRRTSRNHAQGPSGMRSSPRTCSPERPKIPAPA